MKATFENSVDVLVKSYLNDTLQLFNCYACAVGNLVANACGFKFERHPKIILTTGKSFISWGYSNRFNWHEAKYNGKHTDQSLATGYTVDEIKYIERAFEGWGGKYLSVSIEDRKNEFCGLLRVVDVLAEIHGVDLTVKENAIGQFQKVHATK